MLQRRSTWTDSALLSDQKKYRAVSHVWSAAAVECSERVQARRCIAWGADAQECKSTTLACSPPLEGERCSESCLVKCRHLTTYYRSFSPPVTSTTSAGPAKAETEYKPSHSTIMGIYNKFKWGTTAYGRTVGVAWCAAKHHKIPENDIFLMFGTLKIVLRLFSLWSECRKLQSFKIGCCMWHPF